MNVLRNPWTTLHTAKRSGVCSDSQLVVVVGSAAATRLELSRARGGLNETSASGGVREPALLAYIIYRKKKEKKESKRVLCCERGNSEGLSLCAGAAGGP